MSSRRGPRALVRSVPGAGWTCALVAVLNCLAWSLVTPAFQVPDEADHYAYVEQLATHGRPPADEAQYVWSSAQEATLEALETEPVKFHPAVKTIWSQAEHDELLRAIETNRERANGNGASLAGSPQPPLYYALELPAYALGAERSPLASLAWMRVASALLGGVTALCAFLFLREALPARPWTWTVGALGVAVQPLFGFISGAVNPDALLFASSAALFLCVARAFRRGLTTRLAVGTGAVIAVGLLGKLNVVGLLPGALLGLVLAAARQQRGLSPSALKLPALATAVAAVPIALVAALNGAAWDRPTIGATSGLFEPQTGAASPTGALTYLWQFYVARLPAAESEGVGFALQETWVRGFVGVFGWVDTTFRDWVYGVAAALLAIVVVLAAASLVRSRATVRARLPELLAYAAMAAGLLLLVGLTSYNISLQRRGSGAAQARYLLPLLPLYAALLALAARGAGRRLMPVVGTAIVVLAFAHGIFSQLLLIARYYA